MKEVWKDVFLILLLPGMVLFVGVAIYLDKQAAKGPKPGVPAPVKVEQPVAESNPEESSEPAPEVPGLIQALPAQHPAVYTESNTPPTNAQVPAASEPVSQVETALGNVEEKRPLTPQQQLWTACREGNEEEVLSLLEQKTDPNFYINGFTPLLAASFKGNITIIKALLKAGALLDIVADTNGSLTGLTALMGASWEGHTEIVQELLAAGADVNVRARDGRTALMFASYYGHPDAVKLLLAAGAEVNAHAYDRPGTSLTFAAQNGHLEVVKLLLAAGATDANDLSLQVAQRFEYEDIIKVLEAAKQKNKQ